MSTETPKSLIELLEEDAAVVRVVKIMGRDVHVTQATLEDQAKAAAMYPDGGEMRQAALLVMKCKDAEGKPLFTAEDRGKIAKLVGANKFADVWSALNGSGVDAQAEK